MNIKVKEEVVLEREIDIEDLLCVLKHESETENCTVRVDKNLLKDAALIIESLLDNPKYDANAELVEENERLQNTVVKLQQQIEGCGKTYNDAMMLNNELDGKCQELEKQNEDWANLSMELSNFNSELLQEVLKIRSENESLKRMLNKKSSFEIPKVNLEETKEAKDKVDMVKLIFPDRFNGRDIELMNALAGILLHGLAL